MFDILMYLFETYMHTEQEILVDQDALTDELTRAGFHTEEIYQALAWLEKLADLQDSDRFPYLVSQPLNSQRIFTEEEMQRLDSECRGFLLFLEQAKVLSSETREMAIDRVMALDHHDIDLEDLKWVVLMVLFNVPGNESAYQQMEELLFAASDGVLH